MKIISYNVNGLRSCFKKGWIDWLSTVNPDIICLQEIKTTEKEIEDSIELIKEKGYKYQYYFSASAAKGRHGVAILSKHEPKNVTYGCGNEFYDGEGRVIRADFNDFSLISLYLPSGASGDTRQNVKNEFLVFFESYINNLKINFPNLIVAGDYNIAHLDSDIHNPEFTKPRSGFLDSERKWFTDVLNSGWIDTFRYFNAEEKDIYSWWDTRTRAKLTNKGWRIDYFLATESLKNKLEAAYITPDVDYSDHCPIYLELK